jgi:hypothetical protein
MKHEYETLTSYTRPNDHTLFHQIASIAHGPHAVNKFPVFPRQPLEFVQNRKIFVHALPASSIIPAIALAGTRVMNRMSVEGGGAGLVARRYAAG